MTTITIERALLERVRNALESSSPIKLTQASITEHEFVIRILRSALAAPATSPKQHRPFVPWSKEAEMLESWAAQPATAPEFPADWAQMIHYPECWDTAAYPELRDAIHEALAWSGCSVCKPATAPERKPTPILEFNARWEQSVLDITRLQYYQVVREVEAFHGIKETP